MNRCGSFPLLSAPHSLFSSWTDLKSSEKIPGAPAWRWGEWIWLTGPSGLNGNSTQGWNISSIKIFDQIRYPEIPITLRLIYTIYIQWINHPWLDSYRTYGDRFIRNDATTCGGFVPRFSDPGLDLADSLGIIIIISVLPKSRSFTANSGTRGAILPKGRSSISNSGT